ncbi:MAG: hypothetical protein IPJ71_15435 [Bdellovibrionales bacterium]|nr:hypothetical protein [Bdellovibrionales bacterium]
MGHFYFLDWSKRPANLKDMGSCHICSGVHWLPSCSTSLLFRCLNRSESVFLSGNLPHRALYLDRFIRPVSRWFRLNRKHLAAVIFAELACLPTLHGVPTSVWLFQGHERSHRMISFVHILFPQTLSFTFATLALVQIHMGRIVDLVDARLRFQMTFIVYTSCLMIFVILCEITAKIFTVADYVNPVTATVIFPFCYLLAHQSQNKGPCFFDWTNKGHFFKSSVVSPLKNKNASDR